MLVRDCIIKINGSIFKKVYLINGNENLISDLYCIHFSDVDELYFNYKENAIDYLDMINVKSYDTIKSTRWFCGNDAETNDLVTVKCNVLVFYVE